MPIGLPDGLLAPPPTVDFKQSIANAIGAIVPDGKRTAFIAQVDFTSVHFGFASKVDDHWEIAADLDHPWNGPMTGKVSVLASW